MKSVYDCSLNLELCSTSFIKKLVILSVQNKKKNVKKLYIVNIW